MEFSKEIAEIQREFNFGVKVKKIHYKEFYDEEFYGKEESLAIIHLNDEILIALGANARFRTKPIYTDYNRADFSPMEIPLAFPCAVANKIAKMILQLPIDDRLVILRQFKEKADEVLRQLKEKADKENSYE